MALLLYKNIKFDDWAEDKDEDGNIIYWAEICGKHAKQYADVLKTEIDECGAWGCCSVCGCDFIGINNPEEEQYYIDFNTELVKIIED